MKKIISIILLVSMLLTTNISQAFAASITSTQFSLYRTDGPMYIDLRANCSGLAAMDVHGSATLDKTRNGSLNGTWRIWTNLAPRQNYTLDLICQDSNGRGTSWRYNVRYSGNTMSVVRVGVFNW